MRFTGAGCAERYSQPATYCWEGHYHWLSRGGVVYFGTKGVMRRCPIMPQKALIEWDEEIKGLSIYDWGKSLPLLQGFTTP